MSCLWIFCGHGFLKIQGQNSCRGGKLFQVLCQKCINFRKIACSQKKKKQKRGHICKPVCSDLQNHLKDWVIQKDTHVNGLRGRTSNLVQFSQSLLVGADYSSVSCHHLFSQVVPVRRELAQLPQVLHPVDKHRSMRDLEYLGDLFSSTAIVKTDNWFENSECEDAAQSTEPRQWQL